MLPKPRTDIAPNTLEFEILRLVKLDQEATKKRWEYKPDEEN